MSNHKAKYLARTAPKWGSASAVLQWRLLVWRGCVISFVALGMVLVFGIKVSGSVMTSYLLALGAVLLVGVLLQFRSYRAASRALGVKLTLTSFPPSDQAKYKEWCRIQHLTPYSAADSLSEH